MTDPLRRQRGPYVLGRSLEEQRQARVFAKRQARRDQAEREGRTFTSRPTKEARCEAHVDAYRAALQRHAAVVQDSHVRRYREVLQARAKWHRLKHTSKTIEGRKHRRAEEREHLALAYVVRLMTNGTYSTLEGSGLTEADVRVKRRELRRARNVSLEAASAQLDGARVGWVLGEPPCMRVETSAGNTQFWRALRGK